MLDTENSFFVRFMVIDLKKLRFRGIRETDFRFDFPADDSLITLPFSSFSKPIAVEGRLTVGDGEVYAEGKISYAISTRCSRCFEPVAYEKTIDFDEVFSENGVLDDAYPYYKETVDLGDMVKDNVILSFPYSILCREDCKGVCPVCGVDLNKERCDCKK